MLQEKNAQNGSNDSTNKTQHDLKPGRKKTGVKIKRRDEHNTTAPGDKPSSTHSSMIKNNPRLEKFLTADNRDKVEYHHTTRIEIGSYDESKCNVEAGILTKNPSQMKSNPTPTPQQNHPEEKTLPAACLNYIDEVETSGYNSKDSRNLLEIILPSLKTETNPGLIKIHQVDKFTSEDDLKISLMENKPGPKLSVEREILTTQGILKTSLMKDNLRSGLHNQTPDDKFSSNKIIKVDIPGDKLPSETLTDEENSTKIKETPGLNNDEKFPTKEESESRSLRKSVNHTKQRQECKQLSINLQREKLITRSKINLRPGRLKRPG